MAGWIKLHRAIKENKYWTKGPFSAGQAWIDLILRANHAPNKIMIGNQTLQITRGSFVTSLRGLELDWKWGRKKVEAFISCLETDAMIIKTSTNRYTYISIINYDTYQSSGETEVHPKEKQKRNKGTSIKNEKNLKNENKLKGALPEPSGWRRNNWDGRKAKLDQNLVLAKEVCGERLIYTYVSWRQDSLLWKLGGYDEFEGEKLPFVVKVEPR